ncbi:MAG: bifunctional UDP-N-acetylglucosamine diphosphorylase/glucosamine-1-phosphate N-acetyltransferase GlmU [Chloroflexi bacterium]|nr:MAG: bifunctional UDP-N-acetylglucosamine diphosphorylase/glucosamine-1-phosphate N-acetyltransferase GlmU [Chloroflexota bacterium]
MSDSLNAVILAAGFGKRMQSDLPKVLHPLAGVPMIEHTLRAVAGVTRELPVVVIGHGADQVRQAVGSHARFVLQQEQLGTAHALQMAEPLLSGQPGLLLVTTGDMPLLTNTTFSHLVVLARSNSGPISMLSVVLPDPHGFGRVVRGADGSVCAIVEEAQATPDVLAIRELNASVYCFDNLWLWDALRQIKLSPKGEYYLTDIVGVAVAQGLPVQALIADDPQEALGINTRQHLAEAAAVLRSRINSRWMLAGVSMIDPATTYIDADVSIGRETLLLPGTVLQGSTVIGTACQIGPDVKIANSELGNGCQVSYSVIEDSQLPDETILKPFTHRFNNQDVSPARE